MCPNTLVGLALYGLGILDELSRKQEESVVSIRLRKK